MKLCRVVMLALISVGLFAQPGRPWPRPSPMDQLDRLERMPPERREQLLSRLPPDRRANLERRLQQYRQLSPEQRSRLREQYEMFSRLPPEEQQAVRRLFVRFMNQPPERQDVMRQELQNLRRLGPAARAARLSSPEFFHRFRPNERDIIGRMSDLLP